MRFFRLGVGKTGLAEQGTRNKVMALMPRGKDEKAIKRGGKTEKRDHERV